MIKALLTIEGKDHVLGLSWIDIANRWRCNNRKTKQAYRIPRLILTYRKRNFSDKEQKIQAFASTSLNNFLY